MKSYRYEGEVTLKSKVTDLQRFENEIPYGGGEYEQLHSDLEKVRVSSLYNYVLQSKVLYNF